MNFPLIGNERTKRNVLLMLSAKKIPHAIIIEGETGLGKKTLARYLGKAFLCADDNTPCGACKSCHLVDIGSHPDCMTVEPDGVNVKVNQIRYIRTQAHLAPMMCDGRVFIVDSADSMNDNAQNAFLKVLEEPPQKLLFILLCKNASTLLPTIRSRCVCLSLSPVSIADEGAKKVAELLENKDLDYISLLAAADGNIGKAVSMASENTVTFSQIASEVLLQATQGNKFKILEILQPFDKKREAIPTLIAELLNAVSKEMQKKAVKEYSSFTYEKLNLIYERLMEVEKATLVNPSTKLIFCNIADIFTSC